jgi:hypothetical protein
MLSLQEYGLSSSQKDDLKKFGIISTQVEGKGAVGRVPPTFGKQRLPDFLISGELVVDCETRMKIERYFDDVEKFGPDYYEDNPSAASGGPLPFEIEPGFVEKHRKLIAELVYRFLSPHYYDCPNRLKGVLTRNGFPLLEDDRLKKELFFVQKKLSVEGVRYRPI